MEYVSDPAPHIVLRQVAHPLVYKAARFPELEFRPLGRVGHDLYASDPGYDDVCRSHGWETLRREVTGEPFVRRVIQMFAGAMRERGCLVSPDDWVLSSYKETREETESRHLGGTEPAGSLFTRFDFQAVGAGYAKPPHVDWPRRVVGGVLFCCDAREEGLEGGEFGMWRDADPEDASRICAKPELVRSYPARHNTGVLFLNGPDGYHGPTPIERMGGRRKWIYYSISSRRDAWVGA